MRAKRAVDPEVTVLTRRIFAAFPYQSARSLVATLNAEGEASWYKRRNRDGTYTRARWSIKRLIRMVHNPLYKGVSVWGKDARSKRVQKLLATYQGRAFVHEVPHLRIVETRGLGGLPSTQGRLPIAHRRGEGRHPGTVGSAALFGALLRCPGCESTMYYRNTYLYLKAGRTLDPSYLCGSYHRKANCGSHHMREAEVLELVRPIVRDVLERLDTEAMVREDEERERATDRRPALETELRTITEAKAMLREDRYIKRLIGDVDFEQSMRAFNTRQEQAEAELAALGAPDGSARRSSPCCERSSRATGWTPSWPATAGPSGACCCPASSCTSRPATSTGGRGARRGCGSTRRGPCCARRSRPCSLRPNCAQPGHPC